MLEALVFHPFWCLGAQRKGMVIAMNKMTLTHLSNITAYDDISCPSKAIKRGMHCPLFGCILLTKYIADMPFLIVGTDECGFYGREIIKVVADDPLSYPVYTYSIEENDVVYTVTIPFQVIEWVFFGVQLR